MDTRPPAALQDDRPARRDVTTEPARDGAPRPRPNAWLALLGAIVVVAALGAARSFLVPIAFAALLTFLLSPIVSRLERFVGRVPAVLGAVTVVVALLGGAGWLLLRQLDGVTADLPRFRNTIVAKLGQLRTAREGGAVDEIQKTIDRVQEDLAAVTAPRRTARVIIAERAAEQSIFGILGPMVALGASAGLVVTLVIFMLLERRDLRDRIVSLAGRGHIPRTTRALDEAGSRVARQLLMQSAVNTIYALITTVGLWALDVPYPAVWGIFGGAARYLPYVGPLAGLSAPVIVAFAASEGWQQPLYVLGFMVALEIFTNLVLETVLYAGAAGVSQVGLLVAVTFWTWLWGAMGLLLAIPLTVVLVVIGKHVRGLEFLATLMADTPAATPAQVFYQRLLARDTSDALDLVERHVEAASPRSVYDALVVPALTQAETDRLEGRLDTEGERAVVAATGELLVDVAEHVRRAEAADADVAAAPPPGPRLRVLGHAVTGAADQLALEALARMVDDLPIAMESPGRLFTGELADWARAHDVSIVCLADLPPSSASRAKYVVKRLRAAAPDLVIMVGRWTGTVGVDEASATLADAGAHHVGATLEQSRAFLQARLAALPASEQAVVQPPPPAPAPEPAFS